MPTSRRGDTGPREPERYDVTQSRSVRSVWVWRGFLLMSLIAGGITIALAGSGSTNFAIMWGFITAGWFGIAMYLWRTHSRIEEEEYQRERGARKHR